MLLLDKKYTAIPRHKKTIEENRGSIALRYCIGI